MFRYEHLQQQGINDGLLACHREFAYWYYLRNWEKDEIKEVMSISDRSYFRYRRRVRKAILIHMSWYDYGSEYIERLVESVK